MALHDLTPQLRTRLSPLERLVGWFLVLAALLLATGFSYYLYHTAKRKGWFLTKAPYYTYVDTAAGLKVGDPVKFSGFDAGQVTVIDSMPPGAPERVYVEFVVKDPYFGYLWTEGSVVKIAPAGFLGTRELEVTKGTGGYPIFVFHPLQEVSLAEARQLPADGKWKLAGELRDGTNRLAKALAPLTPDLLGRFAALGRTNVAVLKSSESRKRMTAVWNDDAFAYVAFTGKPAFLLPDETPALTERLERMLVKVDAALPRFLSLAGPIGLATTNAVNLTSNLNATVASTAPAISNLTWISEQFRNRGQLGEWLLPTNLHAELLVALTNTSTLLATSDRAIARADTNLTATLDALNRSLEDLAGITGSLRRQVEANTNLLSTINQSIINTDELVQGLKHHWLLRSAFKKPVPPRAPDTNPPPRLRSPRDAATQF